MWPWLTGAENLASERGDYPPLANRAGCALRGEVSGIDADEINLTTSLWTLPASRSKNGEAPDAFPSLASPVKSWTSDYTR